MQLHYFPSPAETNTLSTEALREKFLLQGLFRRGELIAHYADLDRMVVGGVVPEQNALSLPNDRTLGTSFFLERREIGILNIGRGSGVVHVGGTRYELAMLDCLYVGLGERDVTFSQGAGNGAAFYFVSTPAHANYPTTMVRRADVKVDPIGDAASANRRRILKYIHPDGVKSCQLVLGFTEFESGSVWNTMPPHTHSRRTEVYLYFDLGEQIVVHLMGEPQRTRHLIVRDREVVMSPSWSIHSGAGTGAYRFVWAMGGDNQVFADMDAAPVGELR